ncbi:protein kinase [Mycolicibacterium aromaticivorans JS19b1 = JCM 16368]|uniref:non-specific serine/threonine protein kinase n=1 Tax=Mycolicibacterium aromaticivorans JS19b1 = JCM 16368 TaxID=1440774 RepID=A0A064CI56_9MYCO|nr:serine/threonine-protein kinase [Mycolicibacterium aromaticivorans]KDE98467.1 protein kinase [Mycolicibacterium aromaticivorans JS19b1 = JCM 16368]
MTGHEMLVDRYAIHGVLGRGGMAEVREGWDTRLNRPVAIKLLHPTLSADPGIRHRFEDEARSAARLCHQNIVTVYDFGEHQGAPFIVLERLPGQTLADIIAGGPMPVSHVRSMLDDVLAGLGVAHAAGVLHRDIKPGNILVSAPGDSMKVADFGIAKTAGAAHTMTGQIVGTMSYMSPERVAGAPASVGDDLYAVGLMGYEALVGRRAFPQDNPAALAHAIMDSTPAPVAAVRSDVDPVLAAVIDRAIARNALQRFASAEHMRAALAGDQRALRGDAVSAGSRPGTKVLEGHPIPSAPYRPQPPRQRVRTYGIAAGVLGVLAVSAFALAMEPASSTPAPQPVSTSTPVVPTPSVAPPPSPVVEQPAPVQPPPGGPAGRGHGKGDNKRG